VKFALALFASLAPIAPLAAKPPAAVPQPAGHDGAHDFDFQVGSWRVHHRVKRADPDGWIEFEGDCTNRPLMGGLANVEDNVFYKAGGLVRGVALRAFDRVSGDWAIWWVDGRNPLGAIDPPVKGRFVDGVGTFYSDGDVNGRPMRTRYIWSQITATSARWEQAYSFDAGRTWDTNWVMTFARR
jgi:hypothetical protein